jgi:hypothetical protein
MTVGGIGYAIDRHGKRWGEMRPEKANVIFIPLDHREQVFDILSTDIFNPFYPVLFQTIESRLGK